MVFSASLKDTSKTSRRELGRSQRTPQRAHLSLLFHMITYSNWLEFPRHPRGCQRREKSSGPGRGRAQEEAGLALKMCYRYFPVVKKPHNHKRLDNQERATFLKNEVEFPSEIGSSLLIHSEFCLSLLARISFFLILQEWLFKSLLL